jgi:autotransporter strand-loop-strand O-heptosyltransferase
MEKSLIRICSASLGDTIGAMSVIDSYRSKNNKNVSVICNLHSEYFCNSYPEIKKIYPHNSIPDYAPDIDKWVMDGIEYDEYKQIVYKFDKPLMKGYAQQLDVKEWNRPIIDSFVKERPIKGKYVCFSMHSTAQSKHWNYEEGWDQLCKMLRKAGITPVCIDVHERFGNDGNWNTVPKSCVKRNGMDLKEMSNYIHHSEFFIGLSSGLTWVAHALGKPVVMISGVTSEDNEFSEDTVRLINKDVCHGCINNHQHKFDSGDWLWCPLHKGTEKHFECTKTITPEQVFNSLSHLLPKE